MGYNNLTMQLLAIRRATALFVLVFALLLVVMPYVASAAPLDGRIVPTCDAADQAEVGFAGACQLCDLVKLANNMVGFAVAFSTVVATLMFAYAGILYVTAASNPENIKKAHSIFIKVLVGLVLILISWLIVDIIMKTIAGQAISGPWRSIECIPYPKASALAQAPTPTVRAGGQGGGAGGLPYNKDLEDSTRARLARGHITINNSNNRCETPQASGCTNVGGLSDIVLNGLFAIKQGCNCTVEITGGTEQGPHTGHTGNQVDIRTSDAVGNYITEHRDELGITAVCTTHAQQKYRFQCSHVETQEHLHLDFD